MASFSFQVSIVSRAPRKGNPGNAVQSAAYIARERLTDDRTGITYDYRAKGGIEFKGIYTPKNAPKWMQDRETLWNAVLEREDESTRADTAQEARKFIIAIPHELNERERLWLVKDFARELSRTGMVVDFAIHKPDEKGDQRNYHAHMMMTMREVTPEGFGDKVREWNARENVPEWRERWAELGAKALERAGHSIEAERFKHAHLSLEMQKEPARERGDLEFLKELDRVPTPHLGPNVLAMEEKGIRTEKGAAHRDIVEHNRQKYEGRADKQFFQTPEDIEGIRREIWNAYNGCEKPKDFIEILKERGLHVARATERDLAVPEGHDLPESWAQKASPKDYVVITPSGKHVLPLDQRNTGHLLPDVRKFMSSIDTIPVKDVTQTRAEIAAEERERDSKWAKPRYTEGRNMGDKSQVASRMLERAPVRVAGALLDAVVGGIEDLVSPKKPPRETGVDWEEEARRAQRERGEERGRGGRDR